MAEPVDGYEFWKADHTALVHVLWAAESDGLTLKAGENTDELASRILQSEWFSAVLAHADTLKQIRGNKGTPSPAREVRGYIQWGYRLDVVPKSGRRAQVGKVQPIEGLNSAIPEEQRQGIAEDHAEAFAEAAGGKATVVRRTVRVVTEYGDWEEAT